MNISSFEPMTLSFGQKKGRFNLIFICCIVLTQRVGDSETPGLYKKTRSSKRAKHFCNTFTYRGHNMFVRTPLHIFFTHYTFSITHKLLQNLNKRYFTLSFRYCLKLFLKSYMQVFQYFENMYI